MMDSEAASTNKIKLYSITLLEESTTKIIGIIMEKENKLSHYIVMK